MRVELETNLEAEKRLTEKLRNQLDDLDSQLEAQRLEKISIEKERDNLLVNNKELKRKLESDKSDFEFQLSEKLRELKETQNRISQLQNELDNYKNGKIFFPKLKNYIYIN